MGVYIAGMGLPDPNHTVLVEINPDGSVFAAYDGGRTRLIECSALYVPPHGRLGDLDVLRENWCLTELGTKVVELVEIDGAPTVVPAEKES